MTKGFLKVRRQSFYVISPFNSKGMPLSKSSLDYKASHGIIRFHANQFLTLGSFRKLGALPSERFKLLLQSVSNLSWSGLGI